MDIELVAEGLLFPEGPVALVEVQGYAFAAFQALADLSNALGQADAARWADRAEAMREAVESRFWQEDLGYYAVALDGTAGRQSSRSLEDHALDLVCQATSIAGAAFGAWCEATKRVADHFQVRDIRVIGSGVTPACFRGGRPILLPWWNP